MDIGLIPSQVQGAVTCPTCHRPIYQDVEHNPVCAAVQNLENVMFKGAGELEEDQAQRWADLHERITGEKHSVLEQIRFELDELKTRLQAMEELATKPASEQPGDPKPSDPKPGDPEKPGEPKQPGA